MGCKVERMHVRSSNRVLSPNEVVKVFKETHIPSVEEVIGRIGRRYRRLKPRRKGRKGLIEFELQRVQLVYNILSSVIEKITQLPQTRNMNEFHATLAGR